MALAAWAGHPRPARACGPDFPPALLGDRSATVLGLGRTHFGEQAARLVDRPPDRFRVVEGEERLPEGVRQRGGPREKELYDRGARAFQKQRFDEAAAAFTALLALPSAERRERSTWAAFMLGRLWIGGARDGEGRQAFQRVRVLARDGFADALGLAVSSLGEEARGRLRAGDVAAAVRLYAEQAAHGSRSGELSLLMVAGALADSVVPLAPGTPASMGLLEPLPLEKVIDDPLTQKLMAVYLSGRPTGPRSRAVLARLQKRLVAQPGAPGLVGGDLLAVALYRAGHYDLAGQLTRGQTSPSATWVRAKLALRAGRLDEGERLLAEVAGALPEGHDDRRQLCGERGAVGLARGQYAEALDLLLAGGHVSDAAYVAERVLSLDELVAFVGRRRPPPALRALLARRLVRAGRISEALGYFDEPEVRRRAERYGEALARGRSTRGTARARALFEAGTLAREHGMEILATEGDPDWASSKGTYDEGSLRGEAFLEGWRPRGPRPFTSADELRRVQESRPAPAADRFLYRRVGADLLARAADELPPRSQAFAAVLCQAAHMVRREPEQVALHWRRYIQHGAMVPFAPTFGRSCPAPDFERAAGQERRALLDRLLWIIAGLGLAASTGVLVAGLGLCRRCSRGRLSRGSGWNR